MSGPHPLPGAAGRLDGRLRCAVRMLDEPGGPALPAGIGPASAVTPSPRQGRGGPIPTATTHDRLLPLPRRSPSCTRSAPAAGTPGAARRPSAAGRVPAWRGGRPAVSPRRLPFEPGRPEALSS